MKIFQLTSTFIALALASPLAVYCQNQTPVSDGGSSSATARQSGATSGSNTSTSAGMVVHNGKPYIVRNNQATPVNQSVIQSGQMLTSDGQVVDIPKGIAGLKSMSSNVADGGSASATARLSGSTSGSQTSASTQDGWILQDGQLYRVESGKATKVDETTIPRGQIMNAQGRTSAIPEGVTGLEAADRGTGTSGSRDSTSSATRTPSDATSSSSSGTSSTTNSTSRPATPGNDASGTSGSRSDTNPSR